MSTKISCAILVVSSLIAVLSSIATIFMIFIIMKNEGDNQYFLIFLNFIFIHNPFLAGQNTEFLLKDISNSFDKKFEMLYALSCEKLIMNIQNLKL